MFLFFVKKTYKYFVVILLYAKIIKCLLWHLFSLVHLQIQLQNIGSIRTIVNILFHMQRQHLYYFSESNDSKAEYQFYVLVDEYGYGWTYHQVRRPTVTFMQFPTVFQIAFKCLSRINFLTQKLDCQRDIKWYSMVKYQITYTDPAQRPFTVCV